MKSEDTRELYFVPTRVTVHPRTEKLRCTVTLETNEGTPVNLYLPLDQERQLLLGLLEADARGLVAEA